MAKIKVDLASMYSRAAELSESDREIAKLQAEVEELRASRNEELEQQLEALRQQLSSQATVQEIDLSAIKPNPAQPRQSFPPGSIQAMAQSLAKDGQLQPAIVMPAGKKFELFDGERRWRAAQFLEWKALKVILMPRPKDLHRKALLTTLHQEDLNPLDKAEALLKEITEQTSIPCEDIPRLLSTVVRRLDYKKRMKQVNELVSYSEAEQKEKLTAFDLNDLEQSVFLVLLGLGLNPASVSANDFRTLTLFPDLQTSIRESHLKAAHAMVLQRLSAKKLKKSETQAKRLRVKATKQVTVEKLSLAETKKLVEELIAKYAPKEKSKSNQSATTAVLRELKKLSLSGVKQPHLLKFRQELQSKLKEVEAELERTKIE
ncbi:ParB/RepB/Spo0J family partition protein [Acaryochloris marina NIES-2412]|uniref:ParB/RepB/Spo0J family partition protein n=1 Tax=Acaryochloris marina TaxID=155978 RepID=UPI004057D940